jgi:hypothetical protein
MRLAAALVLPVSVAAALAACTVTEDPPAPYTANPLGNGQRVADVQNPSSTSYQQALGNANGVNVDVSSVVVTWIDNFDETRDGKSKGTVYVQDVGSEAPYGGISIYQPNYVPASLRPLPGDVLDVVGPYQELKGIGSASFNPGPDPTLTYSLPQLAKPVATFRYEARSAWAAAGGGWPDAKTISLSDLDMKNYTKGRQWEGMLVTLEDVTVAQGAVDSTGLRVTYLLASGDAGWSNTAASISNELYDLGKTDFSLGTHFKSVTGIVTWFYSYHIAPRTKADLVQ